MLENLEPAPKITAQPNVRPGIEFDGSLGTATTPGYTKEPENFDELSVQISHPEDIVTFIETLIQYDSVVTSAMHVLITCQSYGIPCALVVFKGFEEYVHGDGIKYIDYALGADVKVITPTAINPKLDWREIEPVTETIKVPDLKISEVEMAIKEGLRRVSL